MKKIADFEKDRMDMKQMSSINGGGATAGSSIKDTAQLS
jgi:hypothetical protein